MIVKICKLASHTLFKGEPMNGVNWFLSSTGEGESNTGDDQNELKP